MSEQFRISDAYVWIIEGRYDGFIDIELLFESSVKAEDGPYYQYADQLSYAPFKWIPTYVLVNRDYQDLADQFDQAYQELVDEGVILDLSEQFLGVNIVDELDIEN